MWPFHKLDPIVSEVCRSLRDEHVRWTKTFDVQTYGFGIHSDTTFRRDDGVRLTYWVSTSIAASNQSAAITATDGHLSVRKHDLIELRKAMGTFRREEVKRDRAKLAVVMRLSEAADQEEG